jgi:rSAM/selenodomain-associated transferase 1
MKTIVIMTKVPLAGTVKTRLQPRFTPEQSADLAECFLRDTIAKVKDSKFKLIIAYAPAGKSAFFDKYSLSDAVLTGQKGANLGEKIYHAFEFAFSGNSDSVVMIGTDSPTFPKNFIEQAFEKLEKSDAVLGGTADGGFYLIGLRTLRREIFENVAWSSAKTFEQTAQNIKNVNLTLSEVPVWYDVDTPEDLEKLASEFQENKNLEKRAPQTFRWIQTNKL